MHNLRNIYLIGIVAVTLIVVFIYVNNERAHQKELERIMYLEKVADDKRKALEQIRLRFTPCNIKHLTTPRSCYLDSGYKCRWSEDAEMCTAYN